VEPKISQVEITAVQKAINILAKAKNDVNQALAENVHELTKISISHTLTREINKLNFLSGANPIDNSTQQEYPPVTEFMGEPINRLKEVVALDLIPTPTEKEEFLAKVDALQLTFRERSKQAKGPETLIADYSKEPKLLRAVAIRAGLEDARDGLINIDFIQRIKSGLDANDTRAKEEDEINQFLENGISEVVTFEPVGFTESPSEYGAPARVSKKEKSK
jgi:hypothetical protein